MSLTYLRTVLYNFARRRQAREPTEERVAKFNGRREKISVKPTTVDELVKDCKRVDLVKIDVEGFESVVLKGATQTLMMQDVCFLIEYEPEVVGAVLGDGACMELVNMFRAAGHQGYGIRHDGRLVCIDYSGFPAAGWSDILFVHPEGRWMPSISRLADRV